MPPLSQFVQKHLSPVAPPGWKAVAAYSCINFEMFQLRVEGPP